MAHLGRGSMTYTRAIPSEHVRGSMRVRARRLMTCPLDENVIRQSSLIVRYFLGVRNAKLKRERGGKSGDSRRRVLS